MFNEDSQLILLALVKACNELEEMQWGEYDEPMLTADEWFMQLIKEAKEEMGYEKTNG